MISLDLKVGFKVHDDILSLENFAQESKLQFRVDLGVEYGIFAMQDYFAEKYKSRIGDQAENGDPYCCNDRFGRHLNAIEAVLYKNSPRNPSAFFNVVVYRGRDSILLQGN